MRRIALGVLLIAVAPFLSLRANDTYYAALKAQVSSDSSGMGKVYAGTSETAGTYSDTSSKSATQNTTTQNAEKTFYAFAQANEGYEFKGWSTTDNGTDLGSKSPLSTKVKCSSTSSSSPTTTTLYATFAEKLLDAFSITFQQGNGGSYTVNGAAPENLVGLTKVTAIEVKSMDDTFRRWVVNGEYVYDNPYEATFTKDATISAEFLSSANLATITTYEELVSAVADENIVKITIPASSKVSIPAGASVTIASGRSLVVDGQLDLLGTLVANGVVSGNGKIFRVVYAISQGEVITPKVGDGTDCGTMVLKSMLPKYRKTTVTAVASNVTGTPGCTVAYGVLFDGNVTAISKKNPKALRVSFQTGTAVNHLSSIEGDVDELDGDDKTRFVLLADCTVTGPLDDSSRVTFSGIVDCAGKTVSCSASKGAAANALFVNGTVDYSFSNENQNSKATFINCPSVTLKKIKNKSPAYAFYDCGTADAPASIKFEYYGNTANDTNHRAAYFYSGYYNYTFNSTADSGRCEVYGGSYKGTASSNSPQSFIPTEWTDRIEAQWDGRTYWVVQSVKPKEYVAKIGEVKYESLSDAFAGAAASGDTIELLAGVDLSGKTVTNTKSVSIDLAMHNISGGKIVNTGTLTLYDPLSTSTCTVGCDIDNQGTLDLVFGTYTGTIDNKSGTLTVYQGNINGTVVKSGGTVALRGGVYTQDVHPLVTTNLDLRILQSSGKYHVCAWPNWTLPETTIFSKAGYTATPYGTTDFKILGKYVNDNKNARTDYLDADWKRLAELLTFYELAKGDMIDPTLQFDRPVEKNSLSMAVKSSAALTVTAPAYEVDAGAQYRALSDYLISHNYYSKTYSAIISENIPTVGVAVSDETNDHRNYGTVCTVSIDTCKSEKASDGHKVTNTVYVVSEVKRFTIGANGNKAMMRPETGAATFYADLSTAVANAATDGKTILLAADDDESVTVSKPCTIDVNGFAFSGTIEAGAGYRLVVDDTKPGVYVVEAVPRPSITVGGGSPVTVLLPESAYPEDKTTKEAREEWLNTPQANGYKGWQNAVLELDGTVAANKVRTVAGANPTPSCIVVCAPTARTGTGVTVKYRLMASDDGASSSFTAKAGVDDSETSSFELTSADDLSGIKYWRIDVVFSANGGEEVLPSANVMGVKAVVRDGAGDAPAGVTWNDFGGAALTVDKLVSAGVSDGDEIAVWSPSPAAKSYATWKWDGTSWEPATETGAAGRTAQAAKDVALARGTAFWYKRAKAGTFLQIGEHAEGAITTETKDGAKDAPVNNLLVSPWAAPADLAKIPGAEGDRVMVLGDKREYYFGKDPADGTTVRLGHDEIGVNAWGGSKRTFVPESGLVLPANRGCWYISTGGKPTVKWADLKPAAQGGN